MNMKNYLHFLSISLLTCMPTYSMETDHQTSLTSKKRSTFTPGSSDNKSTQMEPTPKKRKILVNPEEAKLLERAEVLKQAFNIVNGVLEPIAQNLFDEAVALKEKDLSSAKVKAYAHANVKTVSNAISMVLSHLEKSSLINISLAIISSGAVEDQLKRLIDQLKENQIYPNESLENSMNDIHQITKTIAKNVS